MNKNKLLILVSLVFLFFLTSCTSVKKGLTGQNKKNGTDEFLVQKKSPLVLPPEFEKLPMPTSNVKIPEKEYQKLDISKIIFGKNASKKKLKAKTEESLLKKIIKENAN